jgi:hypothetical protein
MDEDPPPPHASHPNGTGQRIEPYPRGVYPQPGGYGSYAPSYSYYGQQHHHARGPPPNLVSRAYRDATGNAAGYLNHHWQQPFDVAGEAPPPHHHSQSPRSLAPADLRPSVGGAAGSGRRSSVSLVPPPSPPIKLCNPQTLLPVCGWLKGCCERISCSMWRSCGRRRCRRRASRATTRPTLGSGWGATG